MRNIGYAAAGGAAVVVVVDDDDAGGAAADASLVVIHYLALKRKSESCRWWQSRFCLWQLSMRILDLSNRSHYCWEFQYSNAISAFRLSLFSNFQSLDRGQTFRCSSQTSLDPMMSY